MKVQDLCCTCTCAFYWIRGHYTCKQCCGSGYGSTGSTCFWASWIRIRILISLSKIVRKPWFLQFCDFLFTSKSNMQKNFLFKLVLCWHLEGKGRKIEGSGSKARSRCITQRHGSRIRIQTKMSWIRTLPVWISIFTFFKVLGMVCKVKQGCGSALINWESESRSSIYSNCGSEFRIRIPLDPAGNLTFIFLIKHCNLLIPRPP